MNARPGKRAHVSPASADRAWGWALLAAIGAVAVLSQALSSRALGHGFHNAALATSSLDQWLQGFRQSMPDLDERLNALRENELKSGRDPEVLKERAAQGTSEKPTAKPARRGSLQSNLDAQQRALMGFQGSQCLEVMAYLDPKNIFPEEFPTFQLSKIPEYRRAAKEVLQAMGPEGTRLVAKQARAELLAGSPFAARDMVLHPDYYKDLTECLEKGAAAGHLTDKEIESLYQATQGKKFRREQAALAEKVRKAISMEDLDLATLARMSADAKDGTFRRRLANQLNQRIKEAELGKLLRLATETDDPALKKRLLTEARAKASSAGVMDLLKAGEADDADLQKTVAGVLAQRQSAYKELEKDLGDMWSLARNEKSPMAKAARDQVVLAFQQAPMSHCLHWLGQGDGELGKLIWEQIDGRIQRADAEGRAKYREVALAVMKHPEYNTASRQGALELVARLKDSRAFAEVIEYLPQMPRELWPEAGRVLRELTGKDFGPRAGDGLAKVVAVQKKWQAWLREKK